jgi:hypothetical protein
METPLAPNDKNLLAISSFATLPLCIKTSMIIQIRIFADLFESHIQEKSKLII